MVNYKIYLFRHGKTFFNAKGIFTGWKDSKLAPEGIRNAKKVAEILKNKKFQIAFQTRLSRSKDTLKYVLKFHPECKKILTDNRMIERSYGILEGKSHKKFIDEIGKKIVDLKIEGDAIENLNPENRKKVEKFLGEEEYKAIHRGYNVAVPKGESFADVEKRVKKFIIHLKKFIRKNKVNAAISAHGNSIRLFRKIMEKTSKDEAVKWFIPYDKVFEYNIKG
ncbi:MAG: 2,3-bisphosphoglycerate-dependent phosphoglycerate mutase [Nanoarchaeota archaeon]|nr:2,3-bisphosphoglycerate-dependent phosphoglycerate mutase [Nanoarchaeota archaeon]